MTNRQRGPNSGPWDSAACHHIVRPSLAGHDGIPAGVVNLSSPGRSHGRTDAGLKAGIAA